MTRLSEEERRLKAAARDDPQAAGVYADWLADQGREYEAAVQRQKAGLSRLRFVLRYKSTGELGSEYSTLSNAWGAITGIMARKLHGRDCYLSEEEKDLALEHYEIVVLEARLTPVVVLPARAQKGQA